MFKIRDLEERLILAEEKIGQLDRRTCEHDFKFNEEFSPYGLSFRWQKVCIKCGLFECLAEHEWRKEREDLEIKEATETVNQYGYTVVKKDKEDK